ncbi:MAG: penicillin-binding protein [Acidobacteria bacterium]|nr:penicillin-binding protein [Acidobacteriota bacterium]
MPKRTPPVNRRHFIILTALLGAWTAVIAGRLIQLQIFEHESFARQARRQQMQTVEISPVRGVIYDRNIRPLAMSVEVESVFAVPAEIPDGESTARLLGKVLGLHARELENKLHGDRSFAWVKRKVTAREADRVRQLNLKGIHFQKESKRFYPKRELAAHVLGHVGVDDQGLAGIELVYDQAIRGRPGEMLMERDARRRWFGRTGRPPAPGENLVLTLDESIQYIAEHELDAVIAASRARAGTVIVGDPRTGEILALVNRPTFNPNSYRDFREDAMRNFAIGNIFEPGSTFKIITMASAFEQDEATPDELMDCQMGSISVAGHTIRDWKAFGMLTVTQAFENSSDVCAIKLAMRVGDDQLYRYIREFGFGSPTGIELPGEARGMTKPPERWWKASIGAIAMGQEIGVTPIQMLAAASVIANDGVWVRPRIIRELTARVQDQRARELTPPRVVEGRRVISLQTAARMQALMEGVVEAGTGKSAKPNGYTAAGKTGTAQMLDPATGTYSLHNYVASFVGFAPVDAPQFAMVVVLDSPRGKYHGGDVAAPVFRRIAEQALAYRNVPPSELQPPLSFASYKTTSPRETDPVETQRDTTPFLGGAPGLIVPNFLGQGVRSVTALVLGRRLPVEIEGNGIAFEQAPLPGSLLPEGEKIVIRFRIGGLAKPEAMRPQVAPPVSIPLPLPSSAAAALPASG